MELAVTSRRLSKALAFHVKNWPKKSRIAFSFQHSSFISHRGVITEEGAALPKILSISVSFSCILRFWLIEIYIDYNWTKIENLTQATVRETHTLTLFVRGTRPVPSGVIHRKRGN